MHRALHALVLLAFGGSLLGGLPCPATAGAEASAAMEGAHAHHHAAGDARPPAGGEQAPAPHPADHCQASTHCVATVFVRAELVSVPVTESPAGTGFPSGAAYRSPLLSSESPPPRSAA